MISTLEKLREEINRTIFMDTKGNFMTESITDDGKKGYKTYTPKKQKKKKKKKKKKQY